MTSLIPTNMQDVEYDETTRIVDESVVPIGGTQIHNLYAVNDLENRIPILKTVVIRTATLQEIIDALLASEEFAEFFENYLVKGQWLRYSLEVPYEYEDFKPSTLYFNVSDIFYGNGGLPNGVELFGSNNTDDRTLAGPLANKQEDITITIINENSVDYYPTHKGISYIQIKDKLPTAGPKPMYKFAGYSLSDDGLLIPDTHVFRSSCVIYARYEYDACEIKINGVKYFSTCQRGTRLSELLPRLHIPHRDGYEFVGFSLSHDGDILSDIFVINTDILLYPVYKQL